MSKIVPSNQKHRQTDKKNNPSSSSSSDTSSSSDSASSSSLKSTHTSTTSSSFQPHHTHSDLNSNLHNDLLANSAGTGNNKPKRQNLPHLQTPPLNFSGSLPSPSNLSPTQSLNFNRGSISPTKHPHDDQLLLKAFEEGCKKMFYSGDPSATRAVEQIIKNLPAGSKATFTKQMALVRSRFHRDAASNRRAQVDQLLVNILPSSVIIKTVGNDTSLAALRSPRARHERLNLTKKFIDSHCVRNMVGVHPFFGSLCAVLYLLSLPARKGGSGKRRVEWDIDLALFCEAGGEIFLKESINFLKGVLGFEDHLKVLAAPSLKTTSIFSGTEEALDEEDQDGDIDIVIGHADGDDGLTLEERQELELDVEEKDSSELESGERDEEGPFADAQSSVLAEEQAPHFLKGKQARERTVSDPFLDPMEQVQYPTPKRPYCPVNQPSPTITVSLADDGDPDVSMIEMSYRDSNSSTPKASGAQRKRSPTQNSLDEPIESEVRIFRSPSYLTAPELRELVACFPSFISVRTKALKFDSTGVLDSSGNNQKIKNRRKARSCKNAEQSTRYVGHGMIRISVFEKDGGWKGNWVERFKMMIYRFLGI
ncbi:hypothetical protein BY996DRAFT_4590847 [Phakopsora pachyrhizi]|nr:hypothetical protein BY996DRAFT_4596039 [Phakopsora pachyrhizi]KAI8448638.1 hypothetical protein BY996DRAFT_4590847 [Phakopsora pachyrhizi]